MRRLLIVNCAIVMVDTISSSLGLSIILLLVLPFIGNALLLGALVALAAAIFNLPLTPGTALFTQRFDQLAGGQAPAFALTNVAWAGGFAVGAPLGGFLHDVGGGILAYFPLAVICALTLVATRRVVY